MIENNFNINSFIIYLLEVKKLGIKIFVNRIDVL